MSKPPTRLMLKPVQLRLIQQIADHGQLQLAAETVGMTQPAASRMLAEAEALVGADGYFGVEQTAERIFQFAVGVAGNDPARLDAIKAGIDRGFAEAKEALGDWLPEISYATYDAVLAKLDEWAAGTTAVV